MQQIYTSIYGAHNLENFLMIAAIMVLAVFLPKAAYILYIAIPIRSFFTIDSDARELTGMQQMAITGQRNYLKMNRDQQMRFRRLVGEYIRDLRSAHGDQAANKAAWEKFSRTAQQELKIDPAMLDQWFTTFRQSKNKDYRNKTPRRPDSRRS